MTNGATTKDAISGALQGIRVLDCGHYIPGPLLGMLLADQGADVIKMERPGGDPARREPAFATWNRGQAFPGAGLENRRRAGNRPATGRGIRRAD